MRTKVGPQGLRTPVDAKGWRPQVLPKAQRFKGKGTARGTIDKGSARGINELEEEDVIRNQAGMAKALNRTNVTRTGRDQLKI